MMKLDSLGKFIDFDFFELGELTNVIYKTNADLADAFTMVLFEFKDKSLKISVNDQSGDIQLSVVESTHDVTCGDNISFNKIIHSLLSSTSTLLWVWWFVSHQGYDDGFQFEFQKCEHENVSIQFLEAGCGGTIDIRVVQKL